MSIIHRNQKSLFNITPKVLQPQNNILNSSIFSQQQQKASAYNVEIGNNSSSKENNSAQKRTELLAKAAMQKQKTLLYSDKQNTSAASVSPNSSLLTILYTDFSADENIKKLQQAFNSNENPIINVTVTGQKPANDGLSFSFIIDNKKLTINYDSSLGNTNNANLQYTFADKNITDFFKTADNTAGSNLSVIANALEDISNHSKSAGKENTPTTETISGSSFSCEVSIYKKHSDIRDFLDNLPSTKKALSDDQQIKKQPDKLSSFASAKLLDFITGKDVLKNYDELQSSDDSNYLNDTANIITTDSLLSLGVKESLKTTLLKLITNPNNDPIAAFTSIPSNNKILSTKPATARFNIFLHSVLNRLATYHE